MKGFVVVAGRASGAGKTVAALAGRPSRTLDTWLEGVAGARHRGHEFHYSGASVGAGARFAFDVRRGEGFEGDRDGLTEHRALGTYCQLHAESGAFDAFIDTL